MNTIITQYIEKQLKCNNSNITKEIYEFLINNYVINIDDTIQFDNMLIYKKLKIPNNYLNVDDSYPIEEYYYYVPLKSCNINITLGLDWYGIRKCGDDYSYYIIING